MAIIACKECGHQISDQAASCPSCGAPIAAGPKDRARGKGMLLGVLSAFAALLLIASALWSIEAHRAPGPLLGTIKPSGQPAELAAADRSPPAQHASGELEVAPRPVYQTTAEQLYEDYDANEVATQSKIGDSRIRITGSVTEIDQDTSGHPVVKLWTSADNGVELTLTADQRSAAAQLSKGLAVDIQCDRMQRASGSAHGSRCALLLVDAGPAAPSSLRTRETAPASPVSVPCTPVTPATAAPAVGTAPPTTTTSARIRHRAAPATHPTSVSVEHSDSAQGASLQALSLPTIAVAPPDPATMPPFNASLPPLSAVQVAAAALPSASAAATAAAVAPIQGGDAAAAHLSPVSAEVPAALQGAGPQAPVAAGAAAAGDDLAIVRTKDPSAAEHIASYCAKTTAGNRASFTPSCRRDEIEAWTRLVLHNEFPALDDAARQKCSQAPFPDSFVAKESCAKYELRVN